MRIHIVKEGESLLEVARRVGVGAERIIEVNGLEHPFDLCEGQSLIVPPPAQCHRVRGGETVGSLCREWGVSERRFLRANPAVAKAGEVWPGQSVVRPTEHGGFGSLFVGGWICDGDDWESVRPVLPFLSVLAVDGRRDGDGTIVLPEQTKEHLRAMRGVCPPLLARVPQKDYTALLGIKPPAAFDGACICCTERPDGAFLESVGRIKRGLGDGRMLCIACPEPVYLADPALWEATVCGCDCLWVTASPAHGAEAHAKTLCRVGEDIHERSLCPSLPCVGEEKTVLPDGKHTTRSFGLSEALAPALKRRIPVSRDGETGMAGYTFRTKAGRHAEIHRRVFDDPLSLWQALCEINRHRLCGVCCHAASLPVWAAAEVSLCWEIADTVCRAAAV